MLTPRSNIAVDYLVTYSCCVIAIMFFCLLDFYNWNRVKVRYCDGGSFTGDGSNAVSDGSNAVLMVCTCFYYGTKTIHYQYFLFRLQAFTSEVSAFGRLLWMT